MNRETVRVLWRHELRMILRDRRTIVLAILLPIAAMPLLLFGSRLMQERRDLALRATLYRYAITGTEAESVRALLQTARQAIAEADPADSVAAGLKRFRLEEVEVADAAASLRAKDLNFYVEGFSGREADSLTADSAGLGRESGEGFEAPDSSSRLVLPARLPGVPLVRIVFQGNRDNSTAGLVRMRELLSLAKRSSRYRELQVHGFRGDPGTVVQVSDSTIATPSQVAGGKFGRSLTFYLLLFLFSGAAVVATDIIAGEKERGSLETILTTSAGREEIVTAKQLTILTVGVITTLAQVASIFAFVTLRVIRLPGVADLTVPPAAVIALFLLFLPVAALVSSILLATSAYARSYKEAQLFYLPVLLVSLVPPLAAFLPGIPLRSAIVLVPIANVSIAAREILSGSFDWPMIALVFAAMTGAAIWTIRQSARLLSQERLITCGGSGDSWECGPRDGPALFPRRVLAWYGVMGAVLFSLALNVPALATFRRQLLVNELLIFLGAPLLMVWRYRLDPREAFAFRRVDPRVWVGILLIIPSAALAGMGLFRLVNLIVPVPQETLRQFAQTVLPRDVPLWQLVVFVSLLPGFCEEMAFRGTLLYGLKGRLRPVSLALAVGLIFGLFHIDLFRIATTGFLGIVLTTMALLTGSILPGMVAHAGNNALVLWLGLSGHDLSKLDWWAYSLGALVMLLGLGILYRYRSPYPGLRRERWRDVSVSLMGDREH